MMYRLIHERDRLLEFRTQEVFKVSLRQGPYCPVKEQDCEAEDPPHHLFRGVVRGEVHRGGASGGVSESVMCMLGVQGWRVHNIQSHGSLKTSRVYLMSLKSQIFVVDTR
jgi:hypothetical protein